MTNEEIKRAVKLIDEIAYLKDAVNAKDRKIVIAQQFDGKSLQGQAYGQQCFPLAALGDVDARALVTPVLERKRAELDALRGMERWGVGSVAQAFAGYEALPSPESAVVLACWQVLGLEPGASEMEIERAYRAKARSAHPDAGGSREEWDQLRRAYDQAKASVAA